MEVTCEDVRRAAENLGVYIMAQREAARELARMRDSLASPSPHHWDMGDVNIDLAQLFEKSDAMIKLAQHAPMILNHLLARDEYFLGVSFTFDGFRDSRPRGGEAE